MTRSLIFGGTFNPVHVGHLRAAVEVSEILGFDRVDWTPSFAPLHRADDGLLPYDVRVALLRAAIGGHERFSVNEIDRTLPVPSVTIQTLEAMEQVAPGLERHFLLGDREFLKLHKWRRGRDVAALAHIVIACRTEFDLDTFANEVDASWPASRRVEPPKGSLMAFEIMPGRYAVMVRFPRLDVSASLVRAYWLSGRSLKYLMPDAAIAVLDHHRSEVRAAWSA